jgi:hypothetical protein
MNAIRKRWAEKRSKRRQLGFVAHESGRTPGIPVRVANAHARFECEARQALREWLML